MLLVEVTGTAGTTNTGSGGGGGDSNGTNTFWSRWFWGCIYCICRYFFDDLTTIGAGLTYSLLTSRSGFKVYKFTAGSDTITI